MKRIYELSVRGEFCAAHRLDGYPGDCSRIHGHNWEITAFVECVDLDGLGMGVDFRELKGLLRQSIGEMDHVFLNDLAPFADQNPTAENIARHLYQVIGARLREKAPGARVSRVRVAETPGAEVTYREEP